LNAESNREGYVVTKTSGIAAIYFVIKLSSI
jgi:hypothetical protein